MYHIYIFVNTYNSDTISGTNNSNDTNNKNKFHDDDNYRHRDKK
jgi:hypothetical protein